MEDLGEGRNLKQLSNYSTSALAAFTLYPSSCCPTSPVLHCGSREPGTEPVQHSCCLSGVVLSKLHCCWFGGVFSGFPAKSFVRAAQDSQMHPVKGWGLQKRGIIAQDFCLLENSLLEQKAFLFCLKFSCIPKPKYRTGKMGAIHFLADVFKQNSCAVHSTAVLFIESM